MTTVRAIVARFIHRTACSGNCQCGKTQELAPILSSDVLQNNLLLIKHHVEDIQEALEKKDFSYAVSGLKDITEVVEELSHYLAPEHRKNLEKA